MGKYENYLKLPLHERICLKHISYWTIKVPNHYIFTNWNELSLYGRIEAAFIIFGSDYLYSIQRYLNIYYTMSKRKCKN